MGPQGEKAARNFAEELNSIQDQTIRAFVLECFDKICPEYFWERAAAKRGMYHPKFVDGPGGLVRHVKYACFWGSQFCRAFSGNGQGEDPGPLHDVVIAALIMHDMVKDGDEGRTNGKSPFPIGKYHGVELMEAIHLRVLGGRKLDPANKEDLDKVLILAGVAAHMGVWTMPETYRPWNLKGSLTRKVGTLVHMADYAASRKVDEVIPKLSGFQPV